MKKLVGLLVALSSPFTAHAAARMVSRAGDWRVYSFKRDGKLVCYALSVPKQSRPSDVDHGKNCFLIAPAANGGGNEPEAAREPEFINALRSGNHMTLQATSARATRTSYDYLLSEVTAASERVAHCK